MGSKPISAWLGGGLDLGRIWRVGPPLAGPAWPWRGPPGRLAWQRLERPASRARAGEVAAPATPASGGGAGAWRGARGGGGDRPDPAGSGAKAAAAGLPASFKAGHGHGGGATVLWRIGEARLGGKEGKRGEGREEREGAGVEEGGGGSPAGVGGGGAAPTGVELPVQRREEGGGCLGRIWAVGSRDLTVPIEGGGSGSEN